MAYVQLDTAIPILFDPVSGGLRYTKFPRGESLWVWGPSGNWKINGQNVGGFRQVYAAVLLMTGSHCGSGISTYPVRL